MRKIKIIAFVFILLSNGINAQNSNVSNRADKVAADNLFFEELSAKHIVENWHDSLNFDMKALQRTNEDGIFIVPGNEFQIKSLSSKYYVKQSAKRCQVIFDKKYPMESFVNLMLNRVQNNTIMLSVAHHQYGGKTAKILIPMQNIYDMLARNMEIFCNVTSINTDKMESVLVFHNKKMNFIHMFVITASTNQLFKDKGVVYADLYSNIPQSNIKSLFKKDK